MEGGHHLIATVVRGEILLLMPMDAFVKTRATTVATMEEHHLLGLPTVVVQHPPAR
jgi:hypothetical protein